MSSRHLEIEKSLPRLTVPQGMNVNVDTRAPGASYLFAARSTFPVAGTAGISQISDARSHPLEAAGSSRRLGYVSEADLPLIYAGAKAFAFPSLYEGFGLPVLEAMASGVPVLTSNVSSLPEVCAGIALCVDPRDDGALREGLGQLLEDEVWRARIASDGIAHAANYPWSRCVDETVSVYREIASTARY